MAGTQTTDHNPSPHVSQANFDHFVWDIAWFGLGLPATMSFLSVYAIRIGASATVLGLMAALPAICALVTSSLSRRWRQRYPDSTQAIFWPALLMRLVFFLPALTPFLPDSVQPIWLVIAVALPALPQGMSNVLFMVMMREGVENQRITDLTSRRSMWFNLAVAAGTLAFGMWLERMSFPFNYQSMFLAAFVFSLVSLWHLNQVVPVSVEPSRPADQPDINPWRSSTFRRVVFLIMITYIPMFMIGPVVVLRLVDDLGASESFMAYFALAGQLVAAVMARLTNRVVLQIGSQIAMAVGMVVIGMSALMIALVDSLTPTLLASAVGGAGWTLTAIAIFGFYNDNMPQEHITRYATLWNQITMLTVFIGPMVGTQLVNAGLSFATVLLLGAGLRIVGGLVIPLEMFMETRRARRPKWAAARVGRTR